MFKRTALIAFAMLAAASTTAAAGTTSGRSTGDTQTTNGQCRRTLDIAADMLVNGQGKRIRVVVDDCTRECYDAPLMEARNLHFSRMPDGSLTGQGF